MKITGFTARNLGLKVDASSKALIPPGFPRVRKYPLIVIHTDEGIDGYTMARGAHNAGGEIGQLLRDCFMPQVLGCDPSQTELLWHRLKYFTRHLYGLSDAIYGLLDVAFWDIRGKSENRRVADMLGCVREKVPCYGTGWVSDPTPENVFAEARDLKARGFHGYKLHYWNDLKLDLPGSAAAREAVGKDFPLMQDIAGKYDVGQALRLGRVLDELNFHWLEEPIPDRQAHNLKRLCDELKTPILAGETLRLDELIQHIRSGSLDLARGDVYIKGGITGLHKAMAFCELWGINLEIHTLSSSVLDIANLHVACSSLRSEFMEYPHPVYSYPFALQAGMLEVDSAGYLHLPKGAGLGIELDWDWIDNHTVDEIVYRP